MGGRARNLVFPPARIKRMMRSDKDVGKIAVSAPFLLSKALQLALEDFLTTAAELARQRSLSVITPDQLRHCVENEKRFKSLHRVVEHVPLTCNQVEETKKLSKGRNRNRKENNEEFFESVSKSKSVRRRNSERNGGKKRKKASKQSNVVTNQVVEQQTESMVMEHAGDTEQYANTASQSRQVENKDVSDTAPAEGLSVKVSLQSTAIEDNYDEE
ncbi:CCAAT box binding factor family [Galdieria sulphuraria]|uniref:CCAAT box binding factor family n=1 Tax=Galdieria sulphuraria TaxID=130081 RepID=M2XM53_GALSU|nr:CCAAT box binding factor family [Galdieria sulphuraria]EME31277.1 CCAAT box binding factor family [Galdieria sulphuraria]|eukprot:XP_005707797.1 CCAAT box binding factor family [Galdieria sulphuraria]